MYIYYTYIKNVKDILSNISTFLNAALVKSYRRHCTVLCLHVTNYKTTVRSVVTSSFSTIVAPCAPISFSRGKAHTMNAQEDENSTGQLLCGDHTITTVFLIPSLLIVDFE